MTNASFWTSDHVLAIDRESCQATAPIPASAVAPVAPDLGIWDAWPVQDRDGHPIALPFGQQLWMALGAPWFADPDERHGHARIHLVLRDEKCWRLLGPAMPAGFSPGSREWSGSCEFDPVTREIILYFTAAGERGEAQLTFRQRIFSVRGTLDLTQETPRIIDWRELGEIVRSDPAYYMDTANGPATVGKIKAFRDPAFFHDPADGHDYLLFAGSRANSSSDYNGVIGLARADAEADTGWFLLPPILSADTLNNELERPHVIRHQNLYYLFWSTQRHVFDPSGPTGPTGLYGMVSDALFGRWGPLNGTGLVFANPREAPAQAYSWLVLPDLSVTSFVDDWCTGKDRSFGGTFAPFVRLRLDGNAAMVLD